MSRLFFKTFFIFSFSLILIVLSIGLYGTHSLRQDHIHNTSDLLQKNLTQLELSFLEIPWAKSNPDRFCKEFGQKISARITLINSKGVVLGDTDADPKTMDNHASREEVLQAREKKIGESLRFSHTVGKDMLYLAKQIEGVGYVRIALPLNTVTSEFSLFFKTLVVTLVIGGILILLLGYKTTRWVTAPLEKMTEFSKKLAQGSFDQKLSISSRDELGDLASSLNSMKDQLSSTIHTLREEKQKMGAILGSIYDGVLAIDREKKIILYNKPMLDILNLKDQTFYNKNMYDMVRIPEINSYLEASLRDHKIYQKHIKLIKDQETYFEIIVSPLFSEEEGVVGVVAIFHDITSLKTVEQMRVDFVANVSHEFKTPLTSIQGYADTLIEGALEDSENNKKFLQVIKNNAERLNSLVEDLLTLSRLESLEKIHKEKFDIKKLIADALTKLKPLIHTKKLNIETHIGFSTLVADKEKLEQALSNLLDNAIKYTPEGGNIFIVAHQDEKNSKLTVQDSGIGIGAEHLSRIFERFYRVDKGRDRALGGTGLGLAIVKHVALLHDGYVNVESTLGKGSSFSLFIPL